MRSLPRATAWIAVWLTLTIMGSVALRPFLVERTFHADVVSASTTPSDRSWKLEWIRLNSETNGVWVIPTPPRDTARRDGADSLVHSLPTDDIRTLVLHECRAAATARITTTVAGLTTTDSVEGTLRGTEVTWPVPPMSGKLSAWIVVIIAATCAAALLVLSLAWRGLLRFTRWIDSRKIENGFEHDRRSPRFIIAVCLLIAVAPSIWLAAWAPMFVHPDSTAYFWFARILLESGNLNHFDGWRLPGYGVFLTPFVGTSGNYAAWVGVAQAAMGVGVTLFSFATLRRIAGSSAACIGAILVGWDASLLVWQRALLSESLACFLVTLGVYLFVAATAPIGAPSSTRRATYGPWRSLGLGIAIGAVCAAAAYTRANLAIMGLLLPIGVLAAAFFGGRTTPDASLGRHRPVACAVACIVTTCVLLLPIVRFNASQFGHAGLTAGDGVNRSFFSWLNGTTDWNQTALFTRDELSTFAEEVRTKGVNPDRVHEVLMRTEAATANPTHLPDMRLRDEIMGSLVRESFARQPRKFAMAAARNFVSQLGITCCGPDYARDTSDQFGLPLGGQWNDRTNTLPWPVLRLPQEVRDDFDRAAPSLVRTESPRNEQAFRALWTAGRMCRGVMSVLLVMAICIAITRRQFILTTLGTLVLANATGVAVLGFAGEDRYSMPFYGLMTLVVVGVFATAWSPRR